MILKTIVVFLTLFILLTSHLFAQQENKAGVNWPSFRGQYANGISENFSTPTSWSVVDSKNIKWKTEIPGLGHSSPIIWNDHIFITTAISGRENPDLKVGLYGSIEPVDDETVHQWKVFCLDKNRGKELWKMSGGGDIPVSTPVVAHDLIFINSAHGKLSPIYAIKSNPKGDISLRDDNSSNEYIVWSISRGGAYMQPPLIYGDFLYNLRGNGSLIYYRTKTGELIYKEKVEEMASFSASSVAADGKLYFPSEQEIFLSSRQDLILNY